MNSYFIRFLNSLFRGICKPFLFLFSKVGVLQESYIFQSVEKIKAYRLVSMFFLLIMCVPDQRWKNIYFLGFVATLFLLFLTKLPKESERLPYFQGMDEFFIVFHFWFLISTVTSVFPMESLKYLIAAMMLFFMSLLMLNLIDTVEEISGTVFGIACTVLAVSLIGIYQLKTGQVSVNTSYTDVSVFQGLGARMSATFGNPNLFGEFLIMGIPFVLAAVLISSGTKRYLFASFLLPVMYALLKTGSRSAWLSFAVAVFFFCLLWKPKSVLWLMTAGLFVFYFMPDQFFFRIMSVFNRQDTSIATRKYIYASTINMIKNYPFGVGLGSGVYEAILENYKDRFSTAAHSHNLYLQILVEQGIFGFLAFSVMMIRLTFLSLVHIFKSQEEKLKVILIAAFSSIIAIMVMGLAEHIWFYFRIQFFLWFNFTLLFLLFRHGSSKTDMSIPKN